MLQFMCTLCILVMVSVLGLAYGDCGEGYGFVNSFIGSSGVSWSYGGINPAAQLPYSPLRLGPDTFDKLLDATSGWHSSGYDFNDDKIRAFSHNHVVGAGVTDLGILGIMPFSNKDRELTSAVDVKAPFWWSYMDKSSEKASPGTYSVFLKDHLV